MPSVAVRVKSLGKQEMGAWTPAFMIGITLAFNLLIRLAYPKDFPINLICNFCNASRVANCAY
jgi:hypothetical protein